MSTLDWDAERGHRCESVMRYVAIVAVTESGVVRSDARPPAQAGIRGVTAVRGGRAELWRVIAMQSGSCAGPLPLGRGGGGCGARGTVRERDPQCDPWHGIVTRARERDVVRNRQGRGEM